MNRSNSWWQHLALLTLGGMEVAALSPWVHTISPPLAATPFVRFALVALLVVVLPYGVYRLARALRLRTDIQRVLLLITLGIALALALRWWIDPQVEQSLEALYQQPLEGIQEAPRVLPGWFWALLFAIILWWRGLVLGRERVGPMRVMRSFKAGIISLALFAPAEALMRPARPDFSAGLLFVFLACGLLALVTSRVSTLERLRGGHRNPFDRRWMATIGATALAWVSLGVGVAALLSGRMAWLGRVVEQAAVGLGALMAAPFILLLMLMQPGFERLVQQLPQAEGTPMPTLAPPNLPDLSNLQQAEGWVPPDVRPLFLVLGGALLLGIVLFALRKAAARLERPAPSAFADSLENESVMDGLRRRLDALADRLRGAAGLDAAQRRRAAERIRQVYAEFMDLCARHEVPRPPAVTPLEFIPLTETLLPTTQREVRLLTDAYLRVRYGQLPETQADVQAVEDAWSALKEALKTSSR